jgi:parallel beta-helix repeat protein
LTSTEILRTVREAGNPDAAVQDLIAAANRAGGKDNVSVVIVEAPRFSSQSGGGSAADKASTNPFASRGAVAIYSFILGVLVLGALESRFGWLRPDRTSDPISGARVLVVGTGEGAQFAAINDALSQSRFGDTIELLGGEYREQIRLRNGVNLTSRVPDGAIIRAAPSAASPAIAIVAEKISSGRITGLRILADEKMPLQTGILLDDSTVEIDDSEIAGAGTGVEIRGNSRAVLRANTVHDNVNAGIVISGSATPWLSHNTVARNGRNPRNPRPGVLVSSPARPVLVGNVFDDNGTQAVIIPQGMDGGPILRFNFFLKGEPLGRELPLRGPSKQRRRKP